MGRWTGILRYKDENGKPKRDTINVRAKDKTEARAKVENNRLDDERILYVGPGDAGEAVQEPRG